MSVLVVGGCWMGSEGWESAGRQLGSLYSLPTDRMSERMLQ